MKIVFFLHCGSYTQAIAAHPVPNHETLLQGSGFCKCAAHFPPCMITIHGVCISLHKQAPCMHSVTCRVWPCETTHCMGTLCIPRRGSPGHFLFLVCIQYKYTEAGGRKVLYRIMLLHKLLLALHGAISQERLYWASFWFCGLGQTPGRNLTPLDSTAWLQPPETQNNT